MKFILKFFVGGIAVFLLTFVTLYLFTSGDYKVQKTVSEDINLNSIEINKHKLYYQRIGDTAKPLIIVLHGGPGFDSKYMENFNKLSGDYQVLFYDQLGCGLSERDFPEEISLEIQMSNLNELLNHFNCDSIYLLGHSWGAMLATAFISKYPDKIKKIVLIEPEYLLKETKDIFFENTNYMRPKFSFGSFSFLAKYWFRSLHIDKPDNQAGTDYMLGAYNTSLNLSWHPLNKSHCEAKDVSIKINRFGSVASASLVSSIFDEKGNFKEGVFQNAKDFENKVLLISGECNQLNGNVIQQRHKDFFKNAQLKIIPDAGFFVHLDKPNETINIIRDFLEK